MVDKKVKAALVLIAISVLCLFVVFVYKRIANTVSQSTNSMAVYKDFALRGNPDYFEFLSSGNLGTMAKIRIELPDKQVFALNELPENAIAKVLRKQAIGIGPADADDQYSDDSSRFVFRDGKLVFVVINSATNGLRIGASEGGPLLSLPLSRETLVKEFGEPLEWQRVPLKPHGP